MGGSEKLISLKKDTKKVSKLIPIPISILQPTKYEKPKRKYMKTGIYTKAEKLKNKVVSIFDQFKKKPGRPKMPSEVEKSWYEKLKEDSKFELNKEALKVTRYELDLEKYGLSLYDPLKLLEKLKPLVLKKFEENPMMKQQLTLVCLMKKTNPVTEETETDDSHFHSHQQKILKGIDFDEIFEKMQDKIINSFEVYLKKGSQWQFQKNLKLILNINKIKLLAASSYIFLPKYLHNKKAIINPKNYDQKCLLWCVAISKLLKTTPNLKHPEKISKKLKKKAEILNVKGIKFPCDLSDIATFEKNNNIPINIFGYEENEKTEEKEIFPLRISEHTGEHVNLLLIQNNGKKHYCLINNESTVFKSNKK